MKIADEKYGLHANGVPARTFDWHVGVHPTIVESYAVKATVRPDEPTCILDRGRHCLYRDGVQWSYILDTISTQHSPPRTFDSKEEAAEAFYRRYYSIMTYDKFSDANTPTPLKEIAVLGKWVTAAEYYNAPRADIEYKLDRGRLERIRDGFDEIRVISDAMYDDREDRMFVTGMGFHEVGVLHPPRSARLFSSGKWNIHFWSGYSPKDHWWVWCPEQHVVGEVYCAKCHNVYPDPRLLKFVRRLGPRCKFCLDVLTESGKVNASQWDFDPRFI